MESLRVLIVEDELLIAMSVETALIDAGHIVEGIAAGQNEAIKLAEDVKADCAVVDITLGPGDGRLVAKALAAQGIAVLFATGQCQEVEGLAHTGAGLSAQALFARRYSPGPKCDMPAASWRGLQRSARQHDLVGRSISERSLRRLRGRHRALSE
jgi:CheY-like chemotaxis protein